MCCSGRIDGDGVTLEAFRSEQQFFNHYNQKLSKKNEQFPASPISPTPIQPIASPTTPPKGLHPAVVAVGPADVVVAVAAAVVVAAAVDMKHILQDQKGSDLLLVPNSPVKVVVPAVGVEVHNLEAYGIQLEERRHHRTALRTLDGSD